MKSPMNDDLVKAARVFLKELQRQREAFAGTLRGAELAGIQDEICETLLTYFESVVDSVEEADRLLINLEAIEPE